MVMGKVVDAFGNIATLKLFGEKAREDAYMSAAMREATQYFRDQQRLQLGFSTCLSILSASTLTTTGAIGLWLWQKGAIEIEIFEDGVVRDLVVAPGSLAPVGALTLGAAWRMTPESVVLHTGAIVFNGAFVTLMPAFHLGATYILQEVRNALFDALFHILPLSTEMDRVEPTPARGIAGHPDTPWSGPAQERLQHLVAGQPVLVQISAAKRLRDQAEQIARITGTDTVTRAHVETASQTLGMGVPA